MTDKHSFLTAEQYRALQRDAIVPPGPEELFEYIVETLSAKGLLSRAAAEPFRAQIPPGLFLLVPPKPRDRTADELLQAAAPDARSYLISRDLTDAVEPPAGAYLMVDVDDGQPVGASPGGNGRLPFTLWEGIVHAAVFPMVFETHDLVLAGTDYGSGAVPTLCRTAGRVELRGYWYGHEGYPRRAAPTCALRVGAPETATAAGWMGAIQLPA